MVGRIAVVLIGMTCPALSATGRETNEPFIRLFRHLGTSFTAVKSGRDTLNGDCRPFSVGEPDAASRYVSLGMWYTVESPGAAG